MTSLTMTNSEVDALGVRLGDSYSVPDVRNLDAWRRSHRTVYDRVVARIRDELRYQVSGRPAKSTAAIANKLRRTTMRLSQMQDIAGCRIVVPSICDQDSAVPALVDAFGANAIDRRERPSFGYRAVHIIVKIHDKPVEIQIRSDLQHLWAELSEKLADLMGGDVKYGGGPVECRDVLDPLSSKIADTEEGERKIRQLEILQAELEAHGKVPTFEKEIGELRQDLRTVKQQINDSKNQIRAILESGLVGLAKVSR